MAIGINKVILLGFVGSKPERRDLPSGNFVASFSLATSKSWKDKEGQLCEDTQWHRIVCYGHQVNNVYQYLDKGSLCYVEGELKTDHWEDEVGTKRQKIQVILQKFKCLDRPSTTLNSEQLPSPSATNDQAQFDNWLDD